MSEYIDEKKFEQLFKTYFTPLTVFCRRITKDTDSAKEIAHKSFIKLWNIRNDLNEKNNIKGLLFTMGRNYSLNYLRDNKKFADDKILESYESSIAPNDSDLESSMLQAQVIETVNKLPAKSKQIFMMSRYDYLDNKGIAEKLGVSVKTVEYHITNALKVLKAKFLEKKEL